MSDNSETQKDNLILPTILIMLLDVADLIFEKMNPMDLLATRKVSRDLRTAVDKFGIYFNKIHVITQEYSKSIFIRFDETKIEYSIDPDGGTKIDTKGRTWKIDEDNHVERALNDLKPALLPNVLVFLLEKYYEESDSNFDFLTTLVAWLELEKCILVDQIGLSGFTFDEVLTILPYLDTETLLVIQLICKEQIDQFERITHLEHWKNVVEIMLLSPQFDQIELFFHIKSFVIKVDEFSVQNAIKIRDDLMKRITFNSCEILFDTSKIHRNDIANVFDLDSNRSRPWRFKYSNDEDSFWIRITVEEVDRLYTLCVRWINSSKMQHNNLMLPLVAQKLEHMQLNSPRKSNNCSKMQLKGIFQPSLLDMPLDVADLVFEKMNPMDLLATRKVCRGFRAAVDHFGVRFDRIDFEMYDYRIKMKLDDDCIIYYDAESGGTTVAHQEQKVVIENGNFVEMSLNDLKMVVKHVSNLNICNQTRERNDIIITSFIDVLEIEECIHVKEIDFENISFDDVIVILPYCDSQTLEEIWVRGNGSLDIEKLIHLDQWKVGKRFRFRGCSFKEELLQHLFHFEEIDIYHPFSVQDAIQIRDDLMRRSTFKKCDLLFDTDLFEIAKVFKPDADSDGEEDYDFEYSNEIGRFKISIENFRGDTRFIVTRL